MQYMLLAVLYGALNSVANSLNADMTVAYGSWLAPLLIHAVASGMFLPGRWHWPSFCQCFPASRWCWRA